MSFNWCQIMESDFTIFAEAGGFTFNSNIIGFGLRLLSAKMSYSLEASKSRLKLHMQPTGTDSNQWIGEDDNLQITIKIELDSGIRIVPKITNLKSVPVRLLRLELSWQLTRSSPDTKPNWRFFKNGYQSWTMSRSYGTDEGERVPIVRFANYMQDNLRNLPTGTRGELHSDTFAVLGDTHASEFVAMGQSGRFGQNFYIVCHLPSRQSTQPAFETIWDMDGKRLGAAAAYELDPLCIFLARQSNQALDNYLETASPKNAGTRELPTGWCSWYYYYTRISSDIIRENLQSAIPRNPGWSHFLVDDGYMTHVGDWLVPNPKFPDGMAPIAKAISEAGFTPGLWLAPFAALDKSALYKEHHEWMLKDKRGKPVSAGWNPWWNAFGLFYALDTTHPDVLAYLTEVVHTVVHDWGFRFLKLDFLYAASLEGSAYGPGLTPAERLQLGLRTIREAAGPDVKLLGCGCPLGAAIGHVDAMRIGPDVAPFWADFWRYHFTRDPHALSTKFAVRSILTRCQLHRRFWINDPDCVMLRDTKTKLSENERMTLANAVAITGGMYLLSDDLALLPDTAWEALAKIRNLVTACDTGRAWALDFMEQEFPELVYNSAGYLAIFNFADCTVEKDIDLRPYLEGQVRANLTLTDAWNGESFRVSDYKSDLGTLPPHASRLLKIADAD